MKYVEKLQIHLYVISIILFVYLCFMLLKFTSSSNNTKLNTSNKLKQNLNPPIYCLMISGKNDLRRRFAKVAIENFYTQDYSNKFMVIINEGNVSLFDENIQKYNKIKNRVIEVMINKKQLKLTLGDLRNISLQFVPINAIWTTWDDDDWRRRDYLSIMGKELIKSNMKYLMYKHRIDHNFNTNMSYKITLENGTFIFFAWKDPFLKYDSLEKKEDVVVKNYILTNNNKLMLYDNDPRLYIRFVHKDNTSVFVDKSKTSILPLSKNSNYKEFELTDIEQQYVNEIIENKFKEFK